MYVWHSVTLEQWSTSDGFVILLDQYGRWLCNCSEHRPCSHFTELSYLGRFDSYEFDTKPLRLPS